MTAPLRCGAGRPGEGEVGVVEVRLLDAQVVGDDLVAGQDGRDGVDEVAGPGHDDVGPVRWTLRTSGRSVSSRSSSGADGRKRSRCSGSTIETMPAGVSSAITAAVAEDRDAIGEPLGLLHQVGDEQDGHAAIADRLDEVPGLAARLRVEPGRELVEDRDPRPADEREGDRQALLLAAGEVAVGGVALVLEARGRRSARAGSAGSS